MHMLGPIFLSLGTLLPAPARIDNEKYIQKILEQVKTPQDLEDLYRSLDRNRQEAQRRYEQQLPKKPMPPMTPPKK